ncbi:hypothetical protein K0M31_002254 [Melipona bicolor]|uniref:Uncharacterized protein n=1 Tax=Melipona bicolor TaxID=60889 RepID=A0AA40GH78_9HYME|nr:hypothetical protein K0M31_002254 [Melipona bicolor]
MRRAERHYQQQQRAVVHRIDEVSMDKPNLLSPTLDGSAGLIGVKLDLLTHLPTIVSNAEPWINNDAQETSRDVEEKKEEVDIKDETDKTTFLRGVYIRKPENLDDSDDQLNASNDPSVSSAARTPDGLFSGTIANTAGDLTSTSPTAPRTARQSHYREVADQFQRNPKYKSARNRLQLHRDHRCRLNRLRTIGNTFFINSAIRSLENITRKQVLHDDNKHHRIQLGARASATTETAPTAKFDNVNNRRHTPIADRATGVQRQPRFVRHVAGGTVREYQGAAKDTPSIQQAPRSSVTRLDQLLVSYLFGIRLGSDLFRLIAFDPSYNKRQQRVPAALQPALEPSKNRLHNLGAQLFSGPFVLNRLTLSRNSITTPKPLPFRDCSNLKELHLRETKQITVPYAPRDIALLKTLNHGENRSSLYNSSFRNLDQLIGSRTRITYQ